MSYQRITKQRNRDENMWKKKTKTYLEQAQTYIKKLLSNAIKVKICEV